MVRGRFDDAVIALVELSKALHSEKQCGLGTKTSDLIAQLKVIEDDYYKEIKKVPDSLARYTT